MKQSLQLKVSQSLTMTPQLQQAIKLLQLSTLDLQQEIQNTLDSNPLLEVNEEDISLGADADKGSNEQSEGGEGKEPEKPETASASDDSNTANDESDWSTDNLPEDLPVDSNWDDVYQNAPSSNTPSSSGSYDDDFDFDGKNAAAESLQDHLHWQLNLARLSDLDRYVAINIVDAIDNDGRLSMDIEEILEGLSQNLPELELDEVQAVLHRIQQFDPPGVGARNLQECMQIQLRQLPPDTPWRNEALHITNRYMTQLGNRDYTTLMRRSRLQEDQLKQVLSLIQSLNPTPGDFIDSADTEFVVPDVFVTKGPDSWRVELNPDIAPKLRINSDYASLAKRGDNSSDNTYIRDNLQEARWFLKSLQSRNDTLMKVATKIVEYQRGFLDHGEEAMKPLILSDIAKAVEMHESTISRVTTQKYMHTPRGIFELKFFFSSHVGTDEGGECSSTAIRALLKKFIAEENPRKPLSDNKLTALFAEQGIKVARRTIAKYRESMTIPPSNERKRLV